MKKTLSILAIASYVGSASAQDFQCRNSPSGSPDVSNGRVRCDVEVTLLGEEILEQTFGLVTKARLKANFDHGIADLMALQTQEGRVKLPAQDVVGTFNLSDGSSLQARVTVEAEFKIMPGTGWCNRMQFYDVSTVYKVSETGFASWVNDGIGRVLTNDPTLRRYWLEETNRAAPQMEASTCVVPTP